MAKPLSVRTCECRAGASRMRALTMRTSMFTLYYQVHCRTRNTCVVCSMHSGRSIMLKQRRWLRTGSCQPKTAPQWPVTSPTSIGAWAVILSWTSSVGVLSQSNLLTQHSLNEHYAQQQAYRIQRAASPLWLHQAQQALHTQQARYEACGDLQMMERG